MILTIKTRILDQVVHRGKLHNAIVPSLTEENMTKRQTRVNVPQVEARIFVYNGSHKNYMT